MRLGVTQLTGSLPVRSKWDLLETGRTRVQKQRHQIDALDHTMMFARPVAVDQRNSFGKGRIERGVFHDQEASMR